jgi:subtilisin family serine protease
VVAKEDQAASGAVINLSLGIHPPQDRLARGLAGPLDWSDHGLSERLLVAMLDSVPDGVITLEILLAAADCHGIVVVAASGNEATSEMHPRPEIPARFASSLDVGAVDAARNLACFTNAGRLAAPGGNGVDPGCQPDPTGRSERYWLVVPVSTTSHAEGYAYWAGSSFAAPLVSGVVALAIENAGPVTVPPSWKLDGPVAGSMFDSLREARLDDDTDRDIPLDEIYLIDIGESLP